MSKPSIFRNSKGVNFLLPFILLSALYLLWGLAHGMLDVLNKHFQETFDMSKAQSAFLQFSVYAGYFLMSLPAGVIMRKAGYKKGLLTGLLMFAFGALLFIPACFMHSPLPFFVALFILACGMCVIESGAHPCVIGMGPEKSSERRINIASAFNGVGWIVGPLLGTAFVLNGSGSDFDLAKPYILVAVIVLAVAALLAFARLPEAEIEEEQERNALDAGSATDSIRSHGLFFFALAAQFLYVGAQTGVGTFFINYALEADPAMSPNTAGILLSIGCMGMFFIGRLLSSMFMRWMRPAFLLALFGLLSSICMVLVICKLGAVSFGALFLTYLFMAPMFPTIFALGIKGMGVHTKKASSLLVMTIVGGAVFPIFMGIIGKNDISLGYFLPLGAFAFIAFYGLLELRGKA